MQPTDCRPVIEVGSIAEFNEYYLAARPGRTLAVGGRYEVRDGRQFALGGLHWFLTDSTRVVSTVTAEDEVLPDLPVVRAGFPYGLDRDNCPAVAA
jgi:hypothetical protein